jgi:hypothetical protein
MTDLFDQASDMEQLEREHAIAKARQRKSQYTGRCLYCNDVVEHPKRYCSPECRESGELEASIRGKQFR